MRYEKIGHGAVLRCHKSRIKKVYHLNVDSETITCACGKKIAIDKGSFYKMIPKTFIYTGTKD